MKNQIGALRVLIFKKIKFSIKMKYYELADELSQVRHFVYQQTFFSEIVPIKKF